MNNNYTANYIDVYRAIKLSKHNINDLIIYLSGCKLLSIWIIKSFEENDCFMKENKKN